MCQLFFFLKLHIKGDAYLSMKGGDGCVILYNR